MALKDILGRAPPSQQPVNMEVTKKTEPFLMDEQEWERQFGPDKQMYVSRRGIAHTIGYGYDCLCCARHTSAPEEWEGETTCGLDDR